MSISHKNGIPIISNKTASTIPKTLLFSILLKRRYTTHNISKKGSAKIILAHFGRLSKAETITQPPFKLFMLLSSNILQKKIIKIKAFGYKIKNIKNILKITEKNV